MIGWIRDNLAAITIGLALAAIAVGVIIKVLTDRHDDIK